MPAAKRTFTSLFGVLLVLAEVSLTSAAQNEPVRPMAHGILANDFQAPISFEPNQGQTDEQVKFMARGSGYNLFLTPSNALFLLQQVGSSNDLVPTDSGVLTMSVVGSTPTPKITGRDELPGKSSYFLGRDPERWRTDISNFGKVQYDDIYPGIDLVLSRHSRTAGIRLRLASWHQSSNDRAGIHRDERHPPEFSRRTGAGNHAWPNLLS